GVVVRAVDEASFAVAGGDNAAGLVREQVDGPEEPRRAGPPCAFDKSANQLGEDLVVVGELGEAEQELSPPELRVELRIGVRRRCSRDRSRSCPRVGRRTGG